MHWNIGVRLEYIYPCGLGGGSTSGYGHDCARRVCVLDR